MEGHSIGGWQKDTLVVDTVGFNDLSLLGGIGGGPFPHTEALHMPERHHPQLRRRAHRNRERRSAKAAALD